MQLVCRVANHPLKTLSVMFVTIKGSSLNQDRLIFSAVHSDAKARPDTRERGKIQTKSWTLFIVDSIQLFEYHSNIQLASNVHWKKRSLNYMNL